MRNMTNGSKTRTTLFAGLLAAALIGFAAPAKAATADAAKNSSTSAQETTTSKNEEEVYTERDLQQEADLSGASNIALKDGNDVSITKEGTYVVSGTAKDSTITVEAPTSAKVQIVLDGATITNADFPAIYVKSADKVFVTTTANSKNSLSVTGTFVADASTNTDAVIFSKDDLVLNGKGTLSISSTKNGVTSKDDLKVTGGTYAIECKSDAFEANDHIYVKDGTIEATAGSDGMQGDVGVRIDGGTLALSSKEGLESTTVEIRGGKVSIEATDDGINATQKSEDAKVTPSITISGGEVSVSIAEGDTDALDSNGNLYITGGTVNITAQSAFDYDGEGSITGGTVTVNGEKVTEMQNSMMGGRGGMGGMGGRGGQGNRGTMDGGSREDDRTNKM